MSISLDKEWYTINETSEILGLSTNGIKKRIHNTKSSLIKIKESEYKMEKHKYLINRDYINRCVEEPSKTEWYSVSATCKMIGKSEDWLYKRLRNGSISSSLCNKNHDKWLIHSSYIKEQKQYLANLEENYYSYKETSHILGKSIKGIQSIVHVGTFKDVISSKAGGYISKNEVIKYKEMIEDTITARIIKEELNLSQYQALQLIKNEPQLVANKMVKGQPYYVKVDSYQKFKEGLMYTIKMATEFLNTTYEIANMLMEKKHIKFFNINGLGWRTSKYYLEEYLNREEIPVEQLAMELDIKLNALYKYVYEGEIKTIKHPKDIRLYVHKEEATRFKNSLTVIKMKYHGTSFSDDYFNDRIRFFRDNTVFKETLDLYEVWGKKRLDKSNWENSKHRVTILLNFFDCLLNNLYKEIFLYTDNELKNLFDSLLNSHLQELYLFLKYCKNKRKCNYSGDYIWKIKKAKDIEPYTKEEWRDLTLHVIDIEMHFEKAIKRKKYAETWLWTLLHFSLSWRRRDLNKFKPINLDVVGIDEFEWFENNTFTLEISQIIIKTIKRNMKGIKASKNKKELVFVIPFIFELPSALAFTLCELHRRKTDKNEKKLLTSSIHKRDLNLFFGIKFKNFSNIRSSKTLMTYGWETAVKKGKGALAYWLGGFARSHTHKIDMPNPVTQVYMVTQNTDVSVEEMALHAFERGIFGWQVKVMIDALNNHEPLSLDEMTKAIEGVNKIYSPVMVDSLSRFAVTRHEQSALLLKELMNIPKNELKKKLEEISKLQSPSLLDHSQCLIGVKNCPYIKEVEYNLEIPCLGCKNRIDTNYILDIVNVELFTLIDRLKSTPSTDETSRIKYTHMIRILSYILMDFKRAYDKYDPGYIRSFIDLDKLKSSFQELEQTKFLRSEEEVYV